MSRKQKNKGNYNNNIQAEKVEIYGGLNEQQVRDLVKVEVQELYITLTGKALEEANNRVRALENKFIQIIKKHPERIAQLNDTEVLCCLRGAQKGFAVHGNKNIKNLDDQLILLLLERMGCNNNSLKNLILQQSIEKVSLLTQEQLDLLTLIFLLYRTIVLTADINEFKSFLNNTVKPFLPEKSNYELALSHLQYLGCLNKTALGSAVNPSEKLKKEHSIFFMKGFELDSFPNDIRDIPNILLGCFNNKDLYQINVINKQKLEEKFKNHEFYNRLISLHDSKIMNKDEARDFLISLCKDLEGLFNKWDKSYLKSCADLTSVGRCLALSNLHKNGFRNFDFDVWIKPKEVNS